MNTKTRIPNRLAKEKSPYLLQHQYNPVDWYPWGDEAFTKAKGEDKPIFLSIGYSTCHWCHVMERESFEDTGVARLLNEHFVAIKVDREERPDIDQIYMSVCQRLTGQGGWPLTIFMTPDKKPFFAGTYFPRENKWGRPGLLSILEQINKKWQTDREKLEHISEELTRAVQADSRLEPHTTGAELNGAVIDEAFNALASNYDAAYGGFSTAPKFPLPHNYMFLLRYWQMQGKSRALDMVAKSLLAMYKGGIYDHIGFGFCRYSTDREWLVPHFEKMLYDNALMACVYLEAYQASGEKLYARIAEDIFTYILRDMTAPEGGFYSAEDADSEGAEGKFYVWSPQEVKQLLGEENGETFCDWYDITKGGNFEGKSIPNLRKSELEDAPAILDILDRMEPLRSKLFAAREKRVHPYKDDKILTSWNGLMIAALSKGRRVLQNEQYGAAAAAALGFVGQKLRRQDGRLLARYRDGEAAIPAYLDDYAFLTWGLLELYEATFVPHYLEKAIALTGEMLDLFGDGDRGGFYFYGRDGEQLIARPKETYDGALPSGNSVATLNLLRLARITARSEYEQAAQKQVQFFVPEVAYYPPGYTFFLTALQFALAEPQQIIVAGQAGEAGTEAMLAALQKKFLPQASLLFYRQDEAGSKLRAMLPFLENYRAVDGRATAYLCKNYSCQAPITDYERLLEEV